MPSSQKYLLEVINALDNDSRFKSKCQQWFKNLLKCEEALPTPSCTAALEMAAMLINVKPEMKSLCQVTLLLALMNVCT